MCKLKISPCPFCGKVDLFYQENGEGKFRVDCDCGYNSMYADDKSAAIAAHNRVARAVAKMKETESAKIDLGVNFLKVKEEEANDAGRA